MNLRAIIASMLAAAIILTAATLAYPQAPQRATGAPQAVSVTIVVTMPDGTHRAFTAASGIIRIATVATAVDTDTGKITVDTQERQIEIGCNIEPAPPIPDEEIVPPFPVPGPRFILVIAERDDQGAAMAGMRATVFPKLKASGHNFRWLDDDAKTGTETVPRAYAQHLARAKKTPGPDLFILTLGGKEVFSGVAPVDADAFLDLVRKAGGTIK